SDHAKTAVIARMSRISYSCVSSVAARKATDCAPTTHTNQEPLAPLMIGRSDLPNTANTGTKYPSTSQAAAAMINSIAALVHQFDSARREPSTPVAATKVKNPKEPRMS